MKRILKYIKNAVLIVSLLFVYSTWFVSAYDDETFFLFSIPATILTAFLYKKIEKKFLS